MRPPHTIRPHLHVPTHKTAYYYDFGGEKGLDVNPKEIEDAVFNALIAKPTRLTGAEIHFIRTYMELTQVAFGESVFVDASTYSDPNLIETTLRLL
jgi:DNA-binding transcriptional regulator YiaG